MSSLVGTRVRTSIGIAKSYRKKHQVFEPSKDTYGRHRTKTPAWIKRERTRLRNKIAKASRRKNRVRT